ncbi:uncharacterized protein LOC125246037 isoform X2 [Megalobrama amblycephala]|uniref:uncharacterized protein LOC125246037 isoform X2 n=1 Tax=Megalobrama amblycephala TaxID=75352 RepID=UPI0020143C67|nr:uncharacterized protein LOC125246037 isoform X2 [Megalobrama amblycephala]
MESVSDHLLDALDDLETDELKRFKWRLKNRKGFSRADLEKADAPDTVDLMMKCFVPEEAVKITVGILRKMNQNHLAEQLEKKHKQAQAEGSIEGPDPAGASSEPTKGTDPKTRNDFLQYKYGKTLLTAEDQEKDGSNTSRTRSTYQRLWIILPSTHLLRKQPGSEYGRDHNGRDGGSNMAIKEQQGARTGHGGGGDAEARRPPHRRSADGPPTLVLGNGPEDWRRGVIVKLPKKSHRLLQLERNYTSVHPWKGLRYRPFTMPKTGSGRETWRRTSRIPSQNVMQ